MSTLDLNDISWVRLSFVDVFGTAHSMQIPASRFAEAAEKGVPFDGSSGPTSFVRCGIPTDSQLLAPLLNVWCQKRLSWLTAR